MNQSLMKLKKQQKEKDEFPLNMSLLNKNINYINYILLILICIKILNIKNDLFFFIIFDITKTDSFAFYFIIY